MRLSTVASPADGRRRDGRRKTDDQRNPARQKSHRFAEALFQEYILAAGFGETGAQFAIAQCAAQREQPPADPAKQQGPGVLHFGQDKTRRGEDPRAHHVGDHQNRSREKSDLAPQPVTAKCIFHFLRHSQLLLASPWNGDPKVGSITEPGK
jgi:hypothetical protein